MAHETQLMKIYSHYLEGTKGVLTKGPTFASAPSLVLTFGQWTFVMKQRLAKLNSRASKITGDGTQNK